MSLSFWSRRRLRMELTLELCRGVDLEFWMDGGGVSFSSANVVIADVRRAVACCMSKWASA